MPKTVIRFIWLFSKKKQIQLVALTFVTFPLLYFSLEIPKVIINEALTGIALVHDFFGLSLKPLEYLLTLSFCLLALVVVNGLFKMKLNTMKGAVGEELVRRLRYMLVERLLRFPPRKFEQMPQGEIIATVVQETDPIAGFAGSSFALPLFQGGTLLTILLFMFLQNWVLGVTSIVLVPVQLIIIPRLQKQINILRKQRVKRARDLSSRLGETVDAADEIRIQGTRRYTLAEFSYRFGELYEIRLDLFKKKFFMKFLNNTLAQITPFLFYAIGGYLVLQGELTIGALVAAIAAHKDFLGPWKELLDYYQAYHDNAVRYQQIIRQFNPRDMQKPQRALEPVKDTLFYEKLQLKSVSVSNEVGEYVLRGISLDILPGETIAIISSDANERKKFARVLAGLESPKHGHVTLGGIDLHNINEKSLRLNIGFVNAAPHVFNAAISYNIGYALNHSPPEIETAEQRKTLEMSRKAGNSTDWFDESFLSIWSSLDRFQVESWREMFEWSSEQLQILKVDETLVKVSLQEVFNPSDYPEETVGAIVEGILEARKDFPDYLASSSDLNKIEYFDETQLNRNSSLKESLMFGTLCDEDGDKAADLVELLLHALDENNIQNQSLKMAEICVRKLLRTQDSCDENDRLILQFELYDEEKRSELNQLVSYIESLPVGEYDDMCRTKLMEIFMQLIPSDWPNFDLDPDYVVKFLQTRKQLISLLGKTFPGYYHHFDPLKYNPGLTITNNIMFGRVDESCVNTRENLQRVVGDIVEAKNLQQELVSLFMINTKAGVGGSRIPDVARHGLSLVRTLIKKPSILIMHDALGVRSEEDRYDILKAIQESRPEMTIVWIGSELLHADLFQKVYDLSQNSIRQRL